MRYTKPVVIDFGSIAEHTFTVCRPSADTDVPKGPESPTTHIDKHGECSEMGMTP